MTMPIDTVGRFTDRVENYVRYRPGYPAGVIGLFRDKMSLTPDDIVADIGSGTGISARQFVENGNIVFGVEPNDAMRAAAEEYLKEFLRFRSVNGTSTATTLGDRSVDIIVAAQAFHWFEPEGTKMEFERIIKPGGYVALIWNERQLDSTPFLRGYEQLLLKYATDYQKVRHENVTQAALNGFLGDGFERETFDNVQVLDLAQLTGRLLSSSYTPADSDERYQPMIDELGSLFAKHAENGRIKVFYDTNVFYTRY